jgi:hypothetical protein
LYWLPVSTFSNKQFHAAAGSCILDSSGTLNTLQLVRHNRFRAYKFMLLLPHLFSNRLHQLFTLLDATRLQI